MPTLRFLAVRRWPLIIVPLPSLRIFLLRRSEFRREDVIQSTSVINPQAGTQRHNSEYCNQSLLHWITPFHRTTAILWYVSSRRKLRHGNVLDANACRLFTVGSSRSILLAAFLVERAMKGRFYDEVPRDLEKVFAMIHAYRPEGTRGYYGSDDCMFIPLKRGFNLTVAQDGGYVKMQLSRNGAKVSDVETFALDQYMKIQEWLCVHGF